MPISMATTSIKSLIKSVAFKQEICFETKLWIFCYKFFLITKNYAKYVYMKLYKIQIQYFYLL